MAIPNPVAPTRILALSGDVITVQLRAVPGADNEVILHIGRNGASASQFSIDELRAVLANITQLLAVATAHRLSATPVKP